MGEHLHHHHEVKDYNWAFFVGIVLNIIFVIVEVVYGIIGDSLALIADAGHNLSDVLSLVVAWSAIFLSKKRPTEKFTYGLKKSSILAALFNAVILFVAVGGIIWESIRRLIHPVNVNGEYVIIVAGIGIIINGITALFFFSGSKEDLNIKGAFLHMATDTLFSIGVVISGIIIYFTNFKLIDPLISLTIAIFILISAWSLLKDSLKMAMDSVPKHIDIKNVIDNLKSFEEIEDVHDIHIWSMSTKEAALTAHVVTPNKNDHDELIKKIVHDLKEKFRIFHVTIQFEKDKNLCKYKEICKIKM